MLDDVNIYVKQDPEGVPNLLIRASKNMQQVWFVAPFVSVSLLQLRARHALWLSFLRTFVLVFF